jgi:hypothetical protein
MIVKGLFGRLEHTQQGNTDNAVYVRDMRRLYISATGYGKDCLVEIVSDAHLAYHAMTTQGSFRRGKAVGV